MKNVTFDRRLQIVKITEKLELYIRIQKFREQEIDIHFALDETKNHNSSNIIIELTNFKDKIGNSIIAKLIGAEIIKKNNDSYQININNIEIVKIQFEKEDLKKVYDFSEINFDVIHGDNVYSLKWDYYKRSLIILEERKN